MEEKVLMNPGIVRMTDREFAHFISQGVNHCILKDDEVMEKIWGDDEPNMGITIDICARVCALLTSALYSDIPVDEDEEY